MMRGLAGTATTALVTGSGSGLGAACAARASSAGIALASAVFGLSFRPLAPDAPPFRPSMTGAPARSQPHPLAPRGWTTRAVVPSLP